MGGQVRGGAKGPAQQGVCEGKVGRWGRLMEGRGKTGSPFIGYWRQVHGCCYSTTYHLPLSPTPRLSAACAPTIPPAP